ncbi:HNH endonuclease signature motif containing protein [Mycolicibacterium sp. YH-1]|uniref:HNH endonuclease signature motif containing protein n=1 Tax=Mycolicibacterium sp. YH-1 TaxID=2908837 RepID=UPI001F4BD767|nr:HNH endonuclease signature motif containing protein [Mycolicibacterium sp. YH-1]UNB55703.1 HNH endonuclease [Mycolicibacterium sp. YH-1]
MSVATRASGGEAVAAWARVESAACARRLSAMVAILDVRQSADDSASREQWYLDNWGAVCAEIGAAQQITSAAASNQLLVATSLRDRLPRVAAAFSQGQLSYQLVSTAVWRTALIKDADALRAVDADLADALTDWPPMSKERTVDAIDVFVDRHDPHALRRTQTRARSRGVDIDVDDASGIATLWGELFAHDAKALGRRLDGLADTVCGRDPRTLDQRRADALGALATGADRLTCLCDDPDCAAAAPVRSSAVVYVITRDDTLTDQGDVTARQDAALDGEQPRMFDKPVRELTLAEALTDTDPGELAATAPGVMIDGPVLAGPIIRRLALTAAIKHVLHPGTAPPEPRYVPSMALADFVRCRDLTCRFPGCDEPATACDLDHTIPYPVGPTCASNLKCLCRKHHLLKTFWSGQGGWHDRQDPDGAVIWTVPDGQTYRTCPGSSVLFPELCAPTAPVAASITRMTPHATAPGSGLTMPRRGTSRARARAHRIDDERRLNETDPQCQPAGAAPPF